MPLTLDKLYPPVPYVERGKRVVFGAHPNGDFVVYPNKNNVIIRDLSGNMSNDTYNGHSTEVRCAKFSPSGFYCASGDKSGKLQIWDTTQKEHILKNEFPVLSSVNDLSWSSDNQRIAVGGLGAEKFGKVINAEMGTEVGEVVGMSKAINAIDLKPTRPFRLATGSEDFSVSFFEGPPFKFKKTIKNHTNFVQCCKFSPKGDIFVTAGSDGKMFAYDASTGDQVGEIGSPAHRGGIYGVEFSPSGDRIVSVSADKMIKLWDSASPFNSLSEFAFEDKLENMQLGCIWSTGKIISLGLSGTMTCFDVTDDCSDLSRPSGIIFGHSRPIQRSYYSPESSQLVTASYDGLMCRWDLATGTAEPFVGKEAHKTAINGVVISGDRIATIGVDDRLVFSSLSKKEYEQSAKLDSQPRAISLAPANGLAVVACLRHLYLYSLEGAPSLLETLAITSNEATAVCITSSGNLVAVGKANGSLGLVVTGGGKTLKDVSGVSQMVAGECTDMAFSPDGTYLAVGDAERHVRLFKVEGSPDGGDAASPKLIAGNVWRSHSARVTCVSWSPDSSHVASGGLDCSIIVFKPGVGTKVAEFKNAHPANLITSLIWKSNDELISTGQDACIRTWKFS